MPKLKDFATSYLSIIISIITNFVLLPVYLKYFGADDYGAWIVINTLVQYLALANFGIPTSLMVTGANLKNKSIIGKLYNKCLKLILIIVASVVIITIVLILARILVPEVFFGSSNKNLYYFNSLVVCFVLYCLRSPIQLSLSIFSALGKVYLNKIYEILTNISWPLAFLIVYYMGYGLQGYIIIAGILMLIFSICSFIHSNVLVKQEAKKNEEVIENEVPSNKSILRSSAGYFLISIGAALVWNTDNIVIAKFLPIHEVTVYSLTFRIYTLGFVIFSTINSVLMPYYGIYKSQNNLVQLQKSYYNSIIVSSFLAMGIWIVTFLFSREIVLFWTKDTELYGGRYLFLTMGFYGFVLSFLSSTGIFLSSVKILRTSIYLTFIEGITNLVVSLILISKFKIIGVAIGTAAGALTNAVIINLIFKKVVKNLVEAPTFILLKNFALGGSFILIMLYFRLDERGLAFKFQIIALIVCLYSYLFLRFNGVNIRELKNYFHGSIKA